MNFFSKPYRFGRNKYGGGATVSIRKVISSKILGKHIWPNDTECLFIELHFRKCKLLLCVTSHTPSQNDGYYLLIWVKALRLTANTKGFDLLEIPTQ